MRALLSRSVIASLLAGLALMSAGPIEAASATAEVSYLAGSSVYVGAGKLDGLSVGDTLRVVRDEMVIVRLRVSFLSSRRASCDTFALVRPARIGDAVRYEPHRAAAIAAVTATPPRPDSTLVAENQTPVPYRRSSRMFRGRVGARFLSVRPSAGGGYSQPSLDVRVDGAHVAEQPLDFSVDVRSRRTYQAGENSGVARVYRMLATTYDPAGRRLTLGRQYSPAFSAVSLFDGALVEAPVGAWTLGAFGGTQPEPVELDFSSQVVEGGAYAAWNRAIGPRRLHANVGAVGSFDEGHANRQFAFLQGTYSDARWFATVAQDIDLNPGWKQDLGDPAVSFSSTFLTSRLRVSPALSLNAGYDSRRNVRLYRDRETPETEFDDRMRQGAWLGMALDPLSHLRMGLSGRWNGDSDSHATSWTASIGIHRMSSWNLNLYFRSTAFENDFNDGLLHSVRLGMDPVDRFHLEASGGVRITRDTSFNVETQTDWQGLDLDLGLTRHWYLMLSGERDSGDGVEAIRSQAGLSWFF